MEVHPLIWLGCFHTKVVTWLTRILTQPSIYQKLPQSSDDVTCGFILFTPNGPDAPIILPQSYISIQGQTSASPATQPLTHLHSVPRLSMRVTCNPPRSFLSLTTLQITLNLTPALSLTLPLALIGALSRILQSLGSAFLSDSTNPRAVFW